MASRICTIMLVEAFEESAHAVVPELDGAVVKSSQDPGTLGVESDSLDAVAL